MLRKIIIFLALILILLAVFVVTFFGFGIGQKELVNYTSESQKLGLKVKDIYLNPLGSLYVKGLEYKDKNTEVKLSSLNGEFSPFKLISSVVDISKLSVKDIKAAVKNADGSSKMIKVSIVDLIGDYAGSTAKIKGSIKGIDGYGVKLADTNLDLKYRENRRSNYSFKLKDISYSCPNNSEKTLDSKDVFLEGAHSLESGNIHKIKSKLMIALEKEFVDFDLNVDKPDNIEKPIFANVRSELIDLNQLDPIINCFSGGEGEADSKEKANKEEKIKDSPKSQFQQVIATLDLENILYENIKFAVDSKLDIASDVQVIEPSKLIYQDGELNFSGVNNTVKKLMSAKVSGKDIKFSILDSLYKVKLGDKALIKTLSAEGEISGEDREVSLKADIDDVALSKRLQDLIPFNILFIPFRVLHEAIDSVGSVVLPKEISGVYDELSKALSDKGELMLDEANIDLELKNKDVTVNNLFLNPNLLPTIKFTGEVEEFDKLDLLAKIKVLGAMVPLPIAGTFSLPLPNVVQFPVELVKSLGGAVTDVVSLGSEKDSKVNNNSAK